MFDKSMIESYKKVKVSEGLRERVTGNLYSKGTVLRKRRCYQMAFAVTACIFLIFSGVAFEQYGRVSISFQGEKLTGEPVVAKEDVAVSLQSEPVPAKRCVLDERCITLEIEGKHRIEWNTDSGMLQAVSEETGEEAEVFAGTEYTTSGKTIIRWYPDEKHTGYLYGISGKRKYTICLEYQEEEENWIIYQK